jgi:hypothetical protein
MSSQRERDAAKREQKLKEIDDALEQGNLTIRPMTDAERKSNPPRERPPKGTRQPRRCPVCPTRQLRWHAAVRASPASQWVLTASRGGWTTAGGKQQKGRVES